MNLDYHTLNININMCYTISMTPEDRILLERTLKLAEENNEMLHSLRRAQRLSTTMRGIYWAVILALSFGAYYFIQPYVENMLSLYSQVQENVNAVQDVSGSLKNLLK